MQYYEVVVTRQDAEHAVAQTREFALTLGARRGDSEAGFNPVETLLSAMGSCLLTSLQMVAELSRVPVDGMTISLAATREDRPPRLVAIHYRLGITSTWPTERLERLRQLAEKNSTVFQTLAQAVPVSGELDHQHPAETGHREGD